MTAPAAVLKFGGAGFRSPESYNELADALARRVDAEGPLVVVVSAMTGETEELRRRLHEVDPYPAEATTAGLLTMADTISAHLLTAALHRAGRRATVLAGHQLGIVTDSTYMWARVKENDPGPVLRALADHDVVVLPGGQAVDEHGRPTWLGKNSSDLTALLVAAPTGAQRCEIHSDVDGIHSADPDVVEGTRLLPRVSYDTAATLSLYGAKVPHRRAVHLAKKHGIAIVCRLGKAPFTTGTVIDGEGGPVSGVIVNKRSVVLDHRTAAAADHAHSVYHAEGIDSVRLESGPYVAVIGGYPNLDRLHRLHRRHDLPPARPVGIPVTELSGSSVTTHIAEDETAAEHLARKLHETLADPSWPA
ncbi:aspartate kinase [Streptomyces sp. C36]|uniref:amino acid kinase family protein n=1 Tax=Streptomyces sp. C36 TaxID=3237122 RepID=UPI0034C6B04B